MSWFAPLDHGNGRSHKAGVGNDVIPTITVGLLKTKGFCRFLRILSLRLGRASRKYPLQVTRHSGLREISKVLDWMAVFGSDQRFAPEKFFHRQVQARQLPSRIVPHVRRSFAKLRGKASLIQVKVVLHQAFKNVL